MHLCVLQAQGIGTYRPRRKTDTSKLLKIALQIVRFLPVLSTTRLHMLAVCSVGNGHKNATEHEMCALESCRNAHVNWPVYM